MKYVIVIISQKSSQTMWANAVDRPANRRPNEIVTCAHSCFRLIHDNILGRIVYT